MTSPRIAVGMAVYDEELYLAETVPAVLAQTMPDFRLFLIDNGSTDASWEILQTFRDPRITLTCTERNRAPAEMANFSFGYMMDLWPDCRWFVAAGADDLMAPDYLEAILDTAERHPYANCIFSPWQWIGHPEKGVKVFPAYDAESVHQIHMIPAWHACRRDLWESVGGHDPQAGLGSDWDWAVRASVAGVLEPYQLERPYLSLRVRTERKSQSEECNWPKLHRRLCQVANKPVPAWAR